MKYTLISGPDTLTVCAGTKDINNLRTVRKTCEKTKRVSPNTKILFSNIFYRKDKRNIDKQHSDTNIRLRKIGSQKNFVLTDNSNIKEEHVGVNKLYLNRRGNSLYLPKIY